MDVVHQSRFVGLSEAWCSFGLIHELLGIDVRADPRLGATFRAWSKRFLGIDDVERATVTGLEINRHALETYLVQTGLVSWKWAGVSLGVTADLLQAVVDRLEGASINVPLQSGVSEQLVRQREVAQLHRSFPTLRHRMFSDHSSMCRALHDVIRSEFGLDVQPLVCVTSRILDPEMPDVAAAFDAITLEPVGLRYQVWLNTNKPVNLRPDVCSLKFYAQHEAELRGYVSRGSEPERIDDRLRAA